MKTYLVGFFCLAALVGVLMPDSALAQETYVETVTVEARSLPGERQFSGNVVAQQQVDVSTEVDGQVEQVLVEAGDKVKAGQPLIVLRDAPVRWRLISAQATLKRAEAEVRLKELEQQRLTTLLERKSVSQNLYDQSVAQYQQAQADVAAQQAAVALLADELQRHHIKAPFDGVVTDRLVEVGKWLTRGDTILNLATNDRLRIVLGVPQKYFPYVSSETGVDIRSDLNGQWVESSIERIVPFASKSRTFEVWVSLDNKAQNWLPGMSATAVLRWQGTQGQYPLTLPADTLLRKADGSVTVWKVIRNDEGKEIVTSVAVKEGYQSGKLVAVDSEALAAGDRIVIKGNEKLRPDQQVVTLPGNQSEERD